MLVLSVYLVQKDTWVYEKANEVAQELQKVLGESAEERPLPFLPVVPRRTFPVDASAQVKSAYDPPMDIITSFMPAFCNVITMTPTEWIGWREIKKADWETMADPPAYPLPEVHRDEQGEEVYRIWVKRISRHFAGWITAQELKQTDWEEEKEWMDNHIYQSRRNEQGELVEQPFIASAWEVKKRLGDVDLDFSREQVWDAGDVVYQVKKIKLRRKDIVENWTHVLEVVRILVDQYGDENVRVIAWLD